MHGSVTAARLSLIDVTDCDVLYYEILLAIVIGVYIGQAQFVIS